ncbi:MAG TPA: alanine racemase, partial [Candidatus Binatia bacterium]
MFSNHLGRPTVCYIDHESLRWNFRQIRALVGCQVKILSMVKANGYGHGAPVVARTLATEGSDAFGVAILEEALELRRHGITVPILVLTGVYLDQLELFFEHDLMPVVHDADLLQRLEAAVARHGRSLDVHLKIDTGMGRIGFPAAECDSWLPQIKKLKALRVEGIFSHFSHAESVEGQYTRKQLEIFHNLVERLAAVGIAPPLI